MTKGMVGRICGLGAVCCVAFGVWAERSDAGVVTPPRSAVPARSKTTHHAVASAGKHASKGKAPTVKYDATAKHAVKSSTLKHGSVKATHAKRANAVVAHASLDRRHGGAKHGASTKSTPGKTVGYPLTAHAKP